MLGAQGLWAGRDLYRAIPAVTRGLGFSGLIRRTALFSRLLRHTRRCGGSTLTRILTAIKIPFAAMSRLLYPSLRNLADFNFHFLDILQYADFFSLLFFSGWVILDSTLFNYYYF
jgi:hypothetical protein